MFGEWMMELRHAARHLRRNPGFTLTVVATLAIGIGATTALFSVVHSVLLRPLPFPEPDAIVRIFSSNRELSIEQTGIASGDLQEWRKRATGFSAIAGWYVTGRTLKTDEQASVLRAAQVTDGFFQILNVQPALGRTFTPEETARSLYNSAAAPVGTDLVAVISYRLWQSHFGGDAGVIGKTVLIDRKPWRICAVMPSSFLFPDSGVDIWLPWGFRENPPRDQRYVLGIARLERGISSSEAESRLQSVAAALAQEFPASNKGWSVRLIPLQEAMTGKSRGVLFLLLASGAAVLLIGCANVVILQLIRASQSSRETAVRLALGATLPRLVRQFCSEGLLLAAAGGTGGVAVALGALQWLRWVHPAALPRLEEVQLSLPAMAVAVFLTLAAALLTALAPAWSAGHHHLSQAINESGRSGTGSQKTQRARSALVAAEVGVAVLVLVCAGLLGRSLLRLVAVNPGFSANNVLVLPIFLDNNEYSSGTKVREYYARLTARLSALPGVVSVGGATALPASPLGPNFERPVWAEGRPVSPADALRADVRMVTPDYFRTLGIPVTRGRAFGAQDSPEAPRVLMVNEALAEKIWPGEDPVGKQLVVDYSTAGTYPYQVVGVTGNIRFAGLRSEPEPEIFIPHAQRSYLILNMALRTSGDPRPLIPAVRSAVLEIDPFQPPQSIRPLSDLLSETISQDRIVTGLVIAFATVALLLAMLGIYGAMAYRVAQRTSEIGVRMALGARPEDILRMVLRSGLWLTAIGGFGGLLLALWAGRLLQGLVFGVSTADGAAFAATAITVAVATLAACWLPARRAARADPISALREF